MSHFPAGPLSELLLVRDCAGEPLDVDTAALELALTDSQADVRIAAESIRDLVNAMEQVPAVDRLVLLWCVSDVAQAADRAVEAAIRDRDGVPPDPAKDPEVREFLERFQSWPDRNAQPPAVRKSLEIVLSEARPGAHEAHEAAKLFLGRSVAELDSDSLVGSDYASSDLQLWLPTPAYGYFLPPIIRWDLVDPAGDRASTAHVLGRPASNLYTPDFHRGRFATAVQGLPHHQRAAFYRLLRLIRGRPDLFRYANEQRIASVCWRLWWGDPANWSSESEIGDLSP